GFRGQAEQLLPASAAVQLVGLLHRMAGLMTENGHALGPSAALDVEHHFLLELHQAGMGEIEWDGNARRAVRTEPLARYPRVGPQPDTPLFELLMETADAILEPGAFDRNPQTAEAALEQLLIRQRLPSVFPARHRASEHEGDSASGWCHGMLVATTPRVAARARAGPYLRRLWVTHLVSPKGWPPTQAFSPARSACRAIAADVVRFPGVFARSGATSNAEEQQIRLAARFRNNLTEMRLC